MKDFVNTLEALGFYKYCDPALVPKLKSQFLNGGCLFHEATKRAYSFDWESLVEGGVKVYLEKSLPFLRKLGVSITTINQNIDYDNANYWLTIDDTEFVVYLKSELDNIDPWGLTTIRTFTLVNYFLDKVGAVEEFFLLTISSEYSPFYSDGDAAGIFLSRELHEFICNNQALPCTKEIFWLDDSEFKLISSKSALS